MSRTIDEKFPGDKFYSAELNRLVEKVDELAFKAPKINKVFNNAGQAGGMAETSLRAIGNPLSGDINLSMVVENLDFLASENPVFINANGIFTNEGANLLNPILSLANPLNPAVPTSYEISATITDSKGNIIGPAFSYIKFVPQIKCGVSDAEIISSVDDLSNVNNTLNEDGTGQYLFGGTGYHYFLLPASINDNYLIFSDITPGIESPYGLSYQGYTILIGGIEYNVFRTGNVLPGNCKMLVKKVS